MAPRKLYKIGEVMKHTSLSRQTIHNYTMMGLIIEEERTPSLAADLFCERGGEALAIDRVDRIEHGHRILRLVRLQRTDEMQFEAEVARDQGRPFRLRLLHPVLAEDALARGDDWLDRIGIKCLRRRDQGHAVRFAPGIAAGAGDFRAHRIESDWSHHRLYLVTRVATPQTLPVARTTPLRVAR